MIQKTKLYYFYLTEFLVPFTKFLFTFKKYNSQSNNFDSIAFFFAHPRSPPSHLQQLLIWVFNFPRIPINLKEPRFLPPLMGDLQTAASWFLPLSLILEFS